MSYHDWLQKTILEKKIDPRQLARDTKISKKDIDAFRNGIELPNRYQMNKIDGVLGIRVDESPAFPAKKTRIDTKGHFKPSFTPKTAPSKIKNDYKTPLQPIIDKTCVLTGEPNPERCHYTGIMQSLFGKGMSEKCDNLFVAEISREKHIEFDQPKERKSLQASHDFMVAILLTIKRKLENGQIIFK